MKLWLDDWRNPVDFGFDGWVWARTYHEAITALATGTVEIVSLDHDLGDDVRTGYDVLCWMEENNIWPDTVLVHSMNPVGRSNMERVIRRHATLR